MTSAERVRAWRAKNPEKTRAQIAKAWHARKLRQHAQDMELEQLRGEVAALRRRLLGGHK